jgi:hypothetical protein
MGMHINNGYKKGGKNEEETRGEKGNSKDLIREEKDLPYPPRYPLPEECNYCEMSEKGSSKPKCVNLPRYYVLCIREDNIASWEEIVLPK